MARAKTSSKGTTKASTGKSAGRAKGAGSSKEKDGLVSRPSVDKKNFRSVRETSTQDPDLKRTHHRPTEEQQRLGQERPKDFKERRASIKAKRRPDAST